MCRIRWEQRCWMVRYLTMTLHCLIVHCLQKTKPHNVNCDHTCLLLKSLVEGTSKYCTVRDSSRNDDFRTFSWMETEENGVEIRANERWRTLLLSFLIGDWKTFENSKTSTSSYSYRLWRVMWRYNLIWHEECCWSWCCVVIARAILIMKAFNSGL